MAAISFSDCPASSVECLQVSGVASPCSLRSLLQLNFPFANKLLHVILGSSEFPNLLFKGAQLLFCQAEYTMAGDTPVVADAKNLRQFFQ